MSVQAQQCHGPGKFPGRPPAGTSPWRWLGMSPYKIALYAWDFETHDGEALNGLTTWHRDGTISVKLKWDLTDTQRRCTLAHEMHHIALGGVCSTRCGSNERKVRRATAKWLLPDLAVLADALQARSITTAARQLDTTTPVLFDRLEGLSSRERGTMRELLTRAPSWVENAIITRPLIAVAACGSGR